MKFIATITRLAPQTVDVEIDIPDELSEQEALDLAEKQAHEKAYNIDFSGKEKSAEYEVSIRKAKNLLCGQCGMDMAADLRAARLIWADLRAARLMR